MNRLLVVAATASACALAGVLISPTAGPPVGTRPAAVDEPTAERESDLTRTFPSAEWYAPKHTPAAHARSSARRVTAGGSIPGSAKEEVLGGAIRPALERPRAAVPPADRARTGDAGLPRRTSGSHIDFLTDALFRRLDTNRDGVLTRAEVPTALRGDVGARGEIDPETFAALFRSVVRKLDAEKPAAEYLTAAAADAASVAPPSGVPVLTATAGSAGTGEATYSWLPGAPAMAPNTTAATAAPQPVAVAAATPAPAATAAVGTPAYVGPQPDRGGTPAAAPSRSPADTLFAHYSAVAAGVPPPAARRGETVPLGAPDARPGTTPTAPPTTSNTGTAKPDRTSPAPERDTVARLAKPLNTHPYWVQRDVQNITALFAGARPDVLFLGDSITDFLHRGAGLPFWLAMYAPLDALNFAIAGVTTSEVLWQIETGQVALANPKVVVLLIGSNNLGAGQRPTEAAAGVEQIVTELGAQLPDTKVLLLSILPRGFAANDPFRPRIAETNELLAELDDGARVTYLDIGGMFLSPDGSLSPLVMPDGLHPSQFGYGLYTLAIWDTLTRLLDKP